MFTFMIDGGSIVEISGVPDVILRTCDYDTFLKNLGKFAEKFPNGIFGCVESTDATYNLSEENKISFSEDDKEVGVYYGLCEQ